MKVRLYHQYTRLLLFCAAMLYASASSAQLCGSGLLFFDVDTCHRKVFVIDTSNYKHNIWQIGKPSKTNFDSALTEPNALVTDTLNVYAPGDTSVFYIKLPAIQPGCPFGPARLYNIDFQYRLDIDSLAFAGIEVAEDSASWINLLDSLPHSWNFVGAVPDLQLSTTLWQDFKLHTGWSYPTTDSVTFKFTFITDSDATGRDGWMLDNFHIGYWCEGSVAQANNPTLISLYPNPSHGSIYIHNPKPTKGAKITVQDMQGREAYSGSAPASGMLNLPLPSGTYILRYSTEEQYCTKQIVISR